MWNFDGDNIKGDNNRIECRIYVISPENGESGRGIALDEGPGDGIGSAMSGQDGRMVDDALVQRLVDHLHRDELRTERHHVQVGVHRFVLLVDLGTDLALQTPRFQLENGHSILLADRRCVCPQRSTDNILI